MPSLLPRPGPDAGRYEGLMAAQDCLPNNDVRDRFAAEYSVLGRLWEEKSPPDPMLSTFEADYRWLTQVYVSVQPTSGTGKLLWHALGAKTIELIHQNVHVNPVRDDLETLVVDAELLEAIMGSPDPTTRAQEFEAKLTARLRKHMGNPVPEVVRTAGSVEGLPRARPVEQRRVPEAVARTRARTGGHREGNAAGRGCRSRQGSPHRAVPAGEKPEHPGRRRAHRCRHRRDRAISPFPRWQQTAAGEREVKKALRRSLLNDQLHQDVDLFERAYGYVKQYRPMAAEEGGGVTPGVNSASPDGLARISSKPMPPLEGCREDCTRTVSSDRTQSPGSTCTSTHNRFGCSGSTMKPHTST